MNVDSNLKLKKRVSRRPRKYKEKYELIDTIEIVLQTEYIIVPNEKVNEPKIDTIKNMQ